MRLLQWYGTNRRELPWRGTDDPYRIWLSEVILQQTRVAQGYDYYRRFLDRFPDVKALAEAGEDEVMRLWQGLGYYSRARNLHAAARLIAKRGDFPRTYEEIRSLPGVGDYTAAAVASLAYKLPHAVVDGNVYRVLARHFGIRTPIDTTKGKKEFAQLAHAILHTIKDYAAYNQAIMDFGALQCTPRQPHCTDCPLAASCQGHAQREAESLPTKEKRPTVRTRHFTYIYLRTDIGGKPHTYLHRREAGDIWQGLYEPPLTETERPATLAEATELLALPTGTTFRPVAEGLKHVLTHQILRADCYIANLPSPIALPGYTTISEAERGHYPVPRLVSLLYERIAQSDGASPSD
ncbi:MAG: A/G-specific adenine glycosylase [Alloprevotella sp.]|nr:A/G-specific adenine glycosylase [Alloprevotella sp.]